MEKSKGSEKYIEGMLDVMISMAAAKIVVETDVETLQRHYETYNSLLQERKEEYDKYKDGMKMFAAIKSPKKYRVKGYEEAQSIIKRYETMIEIRDLITKRLQELTN